MAKILIVDDSENHLIAVKYFLEKQGFNIEIISTGDLKEHGVLSHNPDMILLDVVLNNYDGREICRQLKSAKDSVKIPVILISTDYHKLENYEECLADDVIKKPFILPEVIAKIKSVLDVYKQRVL